MAGTVVSGAGVTWRFQGVLIRWGGNKEMEWPQKALYFSQHFESLRPPYPVKQCVCVCFLYMGFFFSSSLLPLPLFLLSLP